MIYLVGAVATHVKLNLTLQIEYYAEFDNTFYENHWYSEESRSDETRIMENKHVTATV